MCGGDVRAILDVTLAICASVFTDDDDAIDSHDSMISSVAAVS